MKTGKDSVVIGNVPSHAQVGDGSVVIGPTDARGNTILNQPMAVGHGAKAGPGSTAIGAFASAGSSFDSDLRQLADLIAQHNDEAVATAFEKFRTELTRSAPDRSAVLKAWDGVKAADAINGANALLQSISASLLAYLGA